MLLSITTTHRPATDLGFLLHKHSDRFQSFDLSLRQAHVYYPEVHDDRCSACLLLDVDAVGLVRGKNPDQNFLLGQYVNDRPSTASSFLSVAIAQMFGSAVQGKCEDRPELVAERLPLGYAVEAVRHPPKGESARRHLRCRRRCWPTSAPEVSRPSRARRSTWGRGL